MTGYDRLDRLNAVAAPDGPRSCTCDPAGNRFTRTEAWDHASPFIQVYP